MAEITTYCDGCGGTGKESGMGGDPPAPVEVDCQKCAGSGNRTIGELDISEIMTALTDIQDRCSDVMDKCTDILGKLNA